MGDMTLGGYGGFGTVGRCPQWGGSYDCRALSPAFYRRRPERYDINAEARGQGSAGVRASWTHR